MKLLMFEFYAKHVIQEEEEQKEEEEYNSNININIYVYQIRPIKNTNYINIVQKNTID